MAKLAQAGQKALDPLTGETVAVIRVYGDITVEVEGGDVDVAITNNADVAEDPASPQWKPISGSPLLDGSISRLCFEANFIRLTAGGASTIACLGVPGAPGAYS